MIVRKDSHGNPMTRKVSHGGTPSRPAATVRSNKGRPHKSAYSEINGHLRVVFPTETTTNKRVLDRAVATVVARMKD